MHLAILVILLPVHLAPVSCPLQMTIVPSFGRELPHLLQFCVSSPDFLLLAILNRSSRVSQVIVLVDPNLTVVVLSPTADFLGYLNVSRFTNSFTYKRLFGFCYYPLKSLCVSFWVEKWGIPPIFLPPEGATYVVCQYGSHYASRVMGALFLFALNRKILSYFCRKCD